MVADEHNGQFYGYFKLDEDATQALGATGAFATALRSNNGVTNHLIAV